MSSDICASFLHLKFPPPLRIQFLNFSLKIRVPTKKKEEKKRKRETFKIT